MKKGSQYPNITIRYDKEGIHAIKYVCDFCLRNQNKPFVCDCEEGKNIKPKEKDMIDGWSPPF